MKYAPLLLLVACSAPPSPTPLPTPPAETTTPASEASAPPAPPVERGPSTADWKKAAVVDIVGASALGCEARKLDDWVRLSCRQPSFFAETAWRVSVHSDQTNVTTNMDLGGVNLTFRFAEGTKLSASILFGMEIFRFRSAFPDTVGELVGAPKKSAKDLLEATCKCNPRNMPIARVKPFGCKVLYEHQDTGFPWPPECIRHIAAGGAEACQNMNECLTSEPSHFKICAPDEVRDGFAMHAQCKKACADDTPCPDGFTCAPTVTYASGDEAPGPTACQNTDELHHQYVELQAKRQSE